MEFYKMNSKKLRLKEILLTCLIFLIFLPAPGHSEESYRFEQMWPVPEQPWYFSYPGGIAIDTKGYIYIADILNNQIQKFTADGQFVTKWGREGSKKGEFQSPNGVAADNKGFVYVADTENHRIQKFTSDGIFVAKWGKEGDGNRKFNKPHGIAVDPAGYVYVADTNNDRIQKFTSDGQFAARWGSKGSGEEEFDLPNALAVDNTFLGLFNNILIYKNLQTISFRHFFYTNSVTCNYYCISIRL
ncbi:SMP-30/gluconolactonase/LRE family protein, partial [Desulfococcaceae bacterium HSG8]|nr:SMP-30/gluconolactonase/LRE family protein [Desulfococcaceae bacterium HSG8]